MANPGLPAIITAFFYALTLCGHPLTALTSLIKADPEGINTVCYIVRRAHQKIVPYLLHQMENQMLPFPSFLWPTFRKQTHYRRIREDVWHYVFTVTLGHLSALRSLSVIPYKDTDFRMVAATHMAVMQHYKHSDIVNSRHMVIHCLRMVDLIIPTVVVTVTQPEDAESTSNRIVDLTGTSRRSQVSQEDSLKKELASAKKSAEDNHREMFSWYTHYKTEKATTALVVKETGIQIRVLKEQVAKLQMENESLRRDNRSGRRPQGSRSRSKSPDRPNSFNVVINNSNRM